MSGGSSSGPPAALAIQPLRGPLGIAPSQDDPSWAITIIARLALSPSTPARQTACPLRASGVDRSARPSKRACHAHQCRSVGLPLPVNQPVNYAKHDTPIALACALGGSTKLSAGGFVLVRVEGLGNRRRIGRSRGTNECIRMVGCILTLGCRYPHGAAGATLVSKNDK